MLEEFFCSMTNQFGISLHKMLKERKYMNDDEVRA